MSSLRALGMLAWLAVASCAETKQPPVQDAVLIDVPPPASAASAEAAVARQDPPAYSAAPVETSAGSAADGMEMPPMPRTLVRPPPIATQSAAPAQTQNPAVTNASAADMTAARESFRDGIAAFEQGNYKVARIAFERAYKLVPMYRVLYNIGQTAHQQGDRSGACRAFKAYLKEASAEEAKRAEPGIKKDCP